MSDTERLINKLSATTQHEVFWLGAADEVQVTKLEKALDLTLPDDFKLFLKKCGGGGIVEQEISGIEDNDALAEFGGTVYFDTNYCRNEFSLPKHFAVIYLQDDTICWCLNTSPDSFGEVISYDVFAKKQAAVMPQTFTDFFEEYVALRS